MASLPRLCAVLAIIELVLGGGCQRSRPPPAKHPPAALLPSAPARLGTPASSAAAKPKWPGLPPRLPVLARDAQALFAAGAAATDDAVGVVCRLEGRSAKAPKTLITALSPRGAIPVVEVGQPGMIALAFAPLTSLRAPLQLEAHSGGSLGAASLLLLATGVGIPIVLDDARPRPFAQAEIPAGGVRVPAHLDTLRGACLAVRRSALEQVAAPHFEASLSALARASERLADADLDEDPKPTSNLRAEIGQAAALLGWDDPRVSALVGREAALRNEIARTRAAIVARAARHPGTVSLGVPSGLRFESLRLACEPAPRSAPRRPSPPDCALRGRVRNQAPVPLSIRVDLRVDDSRGDLFLGSPEDRGGPPDRPLAPGEEREVVVPLYPSEGDARPAPPLRVRAWLFPVVPIGSGRWVAFQRGHAIRPDALSCDGGACRVEGPVQPADGGTGFAALCSAVNGDEVAELLWTAEDDRGADARLRVEWEHPPDGGSLVLRGALLPVETVLAR